METSKTSYFPAATPWLRAGTPAISITERLIQVLLWRTAAFALSWTGWMPTAIRNTVEIDVTNELLAGGRTVTKSSLHALTHSFLAGRVVGT
jgi:hypothetical protein